MTKPEHIHISGPMYSGKTTIAKGLCLILESQGRKVYHIRDAQDGKFCLEHSLQPDIYIWDGIQPPEGIEYRTITTEVINRG